MNPDPDEESAATSLAMMAESVPANKRPSSSSDKDEDDALKIQSRIVSSAFAK
jgi:hypothetical protein